MKQRIESLYEFSKTLDSIGQKYVLMYLITLKKKKHIRNEPIYRYIKEELSKLQ
jgi:hypothetical protein